ncbi:MAG: hypothetical protein AAFS01_05505 [Pseudomonadota bacterium]
MASLVMLAVSGSMNFLFMSGLGKTDTESLVLGAASASADGLKALLPFFIWWGWQEKRRLLALAGSGVWLFFVGFSLLSAVGFSASNRGAITDTREGLAATFETAQRDLTAAERELAGLPEHRPAPVVQNAIEGLKQNRRWTSTRGCTDATATASRRFCEQYFAVRQELASAVEGQRLKSRVEGLKREVARLRDAGAGQDVDPQVSILSKIMGHGEDRVRLLLILVVAVLVELGSSLGLWLSTAHSEIFRRGKKMRVDITESAPVRSAPVERREPMHRAGAQTLAIEAQTMTAQPSEARTMGDVEDYCLSRIDPVADGGVGLTELRADYLAWCDAGNEDAYNEAEFAGLFRAIANEIEVPEVDGVFQGITIRNGPARRAA